MRQRVVGVGGGNGGLPEGHGDLVEAADHVTDGVEAGDAGLLVEVDLEFALVGGQAEAAQQVGIAVVAEVGVDGVEGLVALRRAVVAALESALLDPARWMVTASPRPSGPALTRSVPP